MATSTDALKHLGLGVPQNGKDVKRDPARIAQGTKWTQNGVVLQL